MLDSPSTAVEAALRALDARDWVALFAVLDPDAIAAFKLRQLQHLQFEQATREDLADLARSDGETTASGVRDGGLLKHVFAVSDLAAFEALPAPIILRRWLTVGRGPAGMRPSPERQILGEVFEKPDVAHVVVRERTAQDPDTPEAFQLEDNVRVISVRNTGAGWRVGLRGGLVFDESGGFGIGYDPGRIDPTEGEEGFHEQAPR